jgi:hypothetical protein
MYFDQAASGPQKQSSCKRFRLQRWLDNHHWYLVSPMPSLVKLLLTHPPDQAKMFSEEQNEKF